MNFFVKLGNTIINLDQIIAIELIAEHPASVSQKKHYLLITLPSKKFLVRKEENVKTILSFFKDICIEMAVEVEAISNVFPNNNPVVIG